MAASLLALLILLSQGGGKAGSGGGDVREDHIARVYISGLITDDGKQQKLLASLAKSDRVKAVILRINSPGGTTVGGEALYHAVAALAKKKPVVSVFGTVAASAAYMTAMGSDHIVTRGNSITGSVGVIVQWPDLRRMLGKLGVSMEEIKSGSLKAEPNPFRPAAKQHLGPMKEMIADGFKWFINLVARSRKIDPAKIPGLAEGRIYSGRQAVRLGLADEIGGEDEALKWLEKKRKISSKLPVIDRKPERRRFSLLFSTSLAGFLRQAGLDDLANILSVLYQPDKESSPASAMMSIWRPSLNRR